jgi:hypothetical protein
MKAKEVSVEDAALYKEFDGVLLVHIASMTLEQIQETKKRIETATAFVKAYESKKKVLLVILIVFLSATVAFLFLSPYLSAICLLISTIAFVMFVNIVRKQNLHILTKCLLQDVVDKYIQVNYGGKG